MQKYNFTPLALKGAFLIDCFSADDIRGGFCKIYEENIYKENGIEFSLSESFVSCSAQNVIRGLHFQLYHPQKKIVSVIEGSAWDVIVDIRKNSKTYLSYYSIELNEKNHRALYIPEGFAHGFLALEDNTQMLYLCDGKYEKENDSGIIYNDSKINIAWPIEEELTIHSERDLTLMSLAEYEQIYLNK